MLRVKIIKGRFYNCKTALKDVFRQEGSIFFEDSYYVFIFDYEDFMISFCRSIFPELPMADAWFPLCVVRPEESTEFPF